MNDELKKFFQSQITEHLQVINRTKKIVEKNFLNVLEICHDSIKDGNKIIFLVTEEVQQMLNIFLLN